MGIEENQAEKEARALRESKIEKISKNAVDAFLSTDGHRTRPDTISIYGADEDTLDQVEARMKQYLVKLRNGNIGIARGQDNDCYSVDVETYLQLV